MLEICLLSYIAGYYLNEEKSLRRLCKSLDYAHEGWLVLRHEQAYYLYLLLFFVSFLKSWVWAVILKNTGCFWGFPIGGYLLGNLTAIVELKRTNFSFTFWCGWVGVLLAVEKVIVQISLTVALVCYVVTQQKGLSLKVWKIAVCMVTLVFFFGWYCIYGIVLFVFVYLFGKKQSPLRT